MAGGAQVQSTSATDVGGGRVSVSVFWLALAVGVLFATVWAYLVTRDLFVFTEARSYAYYDPPLDPVRFFLFPEIDWGNGRLTGRFAHRIAGLLCGTAAPCHNGYTALLTGIAAATVFIHGHQLLRHAGRSLLVVVLWVMSSAMLATWLWQSTRFELMAVIATAATGAFWWWVFARPVLGPLARVGVVGVSCLLLAVAFNAKEITWVLLAVMPWLALVRGMNLAGGIRRNLVLCIVPVAYGAWFIAWSLTHVIASQSPVSIIDGTVRLLRVGLGLGSDFMYVSQSGPTFDRLQTVALAGYIAFLVAFMLVLLAAAIRNVRGRGPTDPATVREPRWHRWARTYGAELYLAFVGVVTTVVSGRAATGASAYYLLLAWWTFLVLGVLLVRRVAVRFAHKRFVIGTLLFLYLVPAILAYASLFASGSTYRQLLTASKQMADVGGSLRQLLAGRPLSQVAWLTEGAPATSFFVLRDPAASPIAWNVNPSGSDLWPFLVGGRVTVTPVVEGTAADLRSRLDEFDEPGQVVVALASDYQLLLVAYEGRPLYDASP